MADEAKQYPSETIGSIMVTNLTTCYPSDSIHEVLKKVSKSTIESTHYVYVTDRDHRLIGFVHLSELLNTNSKGTIDKILETAKATLHPADDQEKAVFLAVKEDLDAVPVVDEQGKLLGAVGAKSLIDIMHDEHLEDQLLAAGLHRGRKSSMVQLVSKGVLHVTLARVPWLIFGSIVGVGIGFVVSRFETSLQDTVALAFFIPVVAFIADSIGAQSEGITIRALATLKINNFVYLLRELSIGLLLGIVLGIIGAFGAFLISGSSAVASVVGISLVLASLVASLLGAAVPMFFKKIGVDPALGSGPLATAIQDIISVLIYFLIASLLI